MHQDRLGLVVGVVAHGDGVSIGIDGHGGEKAIARLTGGFLQRQAGFARQLGHLRPIHNTRQSKAGSKLRYKISVGIGFRATQPMIEMRDVQPQPHLRRQATQQMQQTKRIRPARYAHDQRHAVAQQVIAADRAPHLVKQIGHEVMIACGTVKEQVRPPTVAPDFVPGTPHGTMGGIHATDEVPPTMVDVNPRDPLARQKLIRTFLTRTSLKPHHSKEPRMKPVALGVIGCGVIGRHHLAAASQSPMIRVTAVADLIEEKGRELAEQYGIPKRYVEGADLLEDPDIEAVVLAFPAVGRFPLAMKAFRRGIHVLTEKPVAMNAGEVRQMIAVRGDLVAGCCSSRYRFLPSADAVTQFIATGALGELRVIRARNISAAGAPPASPPPTWRLRRAENGGGILMNWGCYDLDYLLGITGWLLRPRTAFAQTWTLPDHYASRAAPDSDAETHLTALIRCEGGSAITYERGEFVASRAENAWQIIGSQGTLHLRMTTEQEKIIAFDAADAERGIVSSIIWQGEEDALSVHAGPVQDFCAAIREGRQPKTSLEQALVVQQISDAIYRSAQLGQAVEVN